VALGYAGWGEGQLDGEMRQHGWYAAEGRAKILFEPLERAGARHGGPRALTRRI
jgi:putative AlgH/UPF0301 family transcriptional regulator